MNFDRRSYLKGAVTTGAIVAGLGGVTAGFGQTNQSARRPEELACPAGTTELARYSVDDGSFTLESGDDVLSIEDVPDSGPVSSFSWTSESVVAVLTVKYGSNLERFEGGFEGEVSTSGSPISTVSVCEPRGGRAVLCELDMDQPPDAYDTEFHLDGDPASGDREGVVHVISTEETTDYAHSMINLLARADERILLSELDAVSYDYYEGSENTGNIPDEVFVTVLTPDDQLKLAVTTVSESVDAETWQELDVYALMGDARWHVEDISFDDLSTSDLSIETARSLRDNPDQGNVNLLSEFSDATLAGVGFGAGNTRQPTFIDRYFDDLVVEWTPDGGQQSVTHDFPALLPFTVEEAERRGRGRGPLVVTHSFQQPEMGVSLDDAVPESVKLNSFGPFAAPPEPGIRPTEIEIDGDTLELRFRPPDVDDELDNGGFIVSGDFELPTGTSFFAEGELEYTHRQRI